MVEVTNTPWHQRTAYVLGGTGIHDVDKEMHVSPFLPMDLTHRFTIGAPGDRLTIAVDDLRGDEPVFSASMALSRVPAGRRAQGRLLWQFPLMTVRVSWPASTARRSPSGSRAYPSTATRTRDRSPPVPSRPTDGER